MGLPSKKRTSRSKKERNSHSALKRLPVSFDSDGNAHMPHRAAPATGKYRGRAVVDVTKRALRRAKKKV